MDEAAATLASLEQYIDTPLTPILTLRHVPGGHSRLPYVADARVLLKGRELAAHTAGNTPVEAVEHAVESLRRRLREIVDTAVATRNEPRVIRRQLESLPGSERRPEAQRKPPEERQIVRQRTYADHPESTYEAIGDMLDLDELFYLFVHVRTGEDVVVHRRDADEDSRPVGLIHPQGSKLADETDEVVVAETSRYSEPLSLDDVRSEMDVVNHRFVFFTDARDGRGRVLYLRDDGDYGLVEPE